MATLILKVVIHSSILVPWAKILCWQKFLWWIVIVLFLVVISLLLSVELTSYESTRKLLAKVLIVKKIIWILSYFMTPTPHTQFSTWWWRALVGEQSSAHTLGWRLLVIRREVCGNSSPTMKNFLYFCHYSFAIHYSHRHL